MDGRRALVVETSGDGRAPPEVMRAGAHDLVALFGERGAETIRARLRCGNSAFPDVVEPFLVHARAKSRCLAEVRDLPAVRALLDEGVRFEDAFLDEARRRGLSVLFVETRDEQWRQLVAVPPRVYLDAAARELADSDPVPRHLRDRRSRNALLNEGDLDAIYEATRRDFGGPDEDWREFEMGMFVGRNAIMARRLDRHLRDPGGLLVMLGAGHFPGPHGVVARLRAMGHTVEPVRLPPGEWPDDGAATTGR